MKDDNLPPDNETVEDGGGCYIAGSTEESIQEMDDKFAGAAKKSIANAKEYKMKEQDAAHSFEEQPKWVTDYNANRQAVNVLETELTRLRFELQQKDEVIKEFIKKAQSLERLYYAGYTIYPKDLNSLIEKAKLNN